MKTGFGTHDERDGPLRPFLVLGLPRSRTAWLANWLTWGRVRCAHDLCEGVGDGERAAAAVGKLILRQGNLHHCLFAGVADTGAAAFLPQLCELLTEPRIVVIERDLWDVCASLRKLGIERPEEPILFLKERLEAAKMRPGVLVVKYGDLESEIACRAILGHVAPGEPFDRTRWLMLRDFNVQLTKVALRRMAAERSETDCQRQPEG